MLAGLGLTLSSLGGGGIYFLLALLSSQFRYPLANVVGIVSLTALGLGLGLLLLWLGFQAWRGAPDAPFRPPRAAWLALLFVLAVAAGQAVLSFDLAPRLLFPPFHLLAGALPSLMILAFVGRRLGGAVRRQEIAGQMASGVLIGGVGSIVIVGLIGLALVVVLLVLVALTPGGLETLQSLAQRLQDPTWGQDPNDLMALVLTPAGVIAVLLLAVIIGPLVEELLKPVGVLLISRRPGRADAFTWGVAGASAFALAEGMLNGAISLDAWLPVTVMRVGTSLVHCLGGGLVGLAWHAMRTARRPAQALGLYLAAAALHGTWNLTALGVSGLAFGMEVLGETVAGLGAALMIAALGLLVLGSAIGLVWLVRWLQARLPEVSESAMAGDAL